MNPIYYLLLAVSLLVGGAVNELTGVEDNNKIDDVQNVIDNMKSGAITPAEAHDCLFDKKYWARQNNMDANAVETEVNQAYIAYINSALDVVTAYSNYGENSKEFNEMYIIMQEKKNLV